MEVSKIVPQFFFDVIARGVPGGALIVGTSIALGDSFSIQTLVMFGFEKDIAIEDVGSKAFFLILLTFYAYAIGHIIAPAGDFIAKSYLVNVMFKRHLHVLRYSVNPETSKLPRYIQEYLKKEVGIDEEKKKTGEENKNAEYTSVLFIWSDWLRFKSADAGARIVKLRAEYRMLIGLSVVGIYTSVLHVAYQWKLNKEPDYLIFSCGIAMFILGILGYCRAYSTFQFGVINSYYAEKVIDEDIKISRHLSEADQKVS